jgi:hypothetical protein
MKNKLLLLTILLGFGGGVLLAKKMQDAAKVEGMLKGCNVIVANTINLDPFLNGNCEMHGDVLAIRIVSLFGMEKLFNAETAEEIE